MKIRVLARPILSRLFCEYTQGHFEDWIQKGTNNSISHFLSFFTVKTTSCTVAEAGDTFTALPISAFWK
jgi:hypothetical protein